MIKAGIIGATGYVGGELVRLLMQHSDVSVKTLVSRSYAGVDYSQVFENFRHVNSHVCEDKDIKQMALDCDIIFLALPHGIAAQMVDVDLLRYTKIIDLGADFRFKDACVYEEWYNTKHVNAGLLNEAVYGLCEIYREKIKNSRLIGNPGCYTTCSILSLAPLLKYGVIDEKSIIIDAKSGVTGGGRGVSLSSHFNEVNENIKAYKIASHRHTPEIEEHLSYLANSSITLTFTPHLIPMNRGIITTAYANLKSGYTYNSLREIYADFYNNEYFIRLTKQGVFPESKWVKSSNFCDIGFTIDERTNRVVVVAALDNLIKGAAGQAVQNMNILFGFDESIGINQIPLFPV